MNEFENYFSRCICIRSQVEGVNSIGCLRRWIIYITGFLEATIFSTCILGWAQLVYVLKNDEIFLDLCIKQNDNVSLTKNYSKLMNNYVSIDSFLVLK